MDARRIRLIRSEIHNPRFAPHVPVIWVRVGDVLPPWARPTHIVSL